MQQIKKRLYELKAMVDQALKVKDLIGLHSSIALLEAKVNDVDFWSDANTAQKISRELAQLKVDYDNWHSFTTELEGLITLIEVDGLDDEAFCDEILTKLETTFAKLRLATFLNGKYDQNDAILTIYCGLGGKDAQDFVQMLCRMYLRFAERSGYAPKIIELSEAPEGGYTKVTIEIGGQFAYGYLKGEAGIMRLIRLSPFNSGNTRETSFARVEVLPRLSLSQAPEINLADLRIDTFRASGAGGQHVNTTDSAVRIVHLPTGVVSQCQSERSQAQNKERAMEILSAKLTMMMEEQKQATIAGLKGEKLDTAFGNQDRTFTLHPYTLVKDHRTGVETNNVNAVLDGDLEQFIEGGAGKFKIA